MKLVRIDSIAPGGRTLELHPRLTVLRGAGPELRRRLERTLRSIADASEPEFAGVIEVSGVQLSLDRATLEQLHLDMVVDPVLVLSDPLLGRTDSSGAPVAAPSNGSAAGDADAGSGDGREELRVVSARRSALGQRLDAARARLDPYANAALETCIGQIEALERQRAALRTEWERARRRHDDELTAVRATAESLRAALSRASSVDPAPVLTARAALVAAIEAPMDQDPEAVALAELLDGTLERLRELQSRRAQFDIRSSEAEQRLVEARRAAQEAAASMQSPNVDREAVERLETVRDEIFVVDDRTGRLGAGRNKRKLQELRVEQAILLDQLGFDTYSAYVMGIPSTRAELERSARVEAAQDRVERIEQEIARLRSEAPRNDEVERVGAELQTLLVRAQRHVGPNEELAVPLDVGGPHSADLIYETIVALRRRRLAAPGLEDPTVRAAMVDLRHCLVAPSWPAGSSEHIPPPQWTDDGVLDRLSASDLLARADEWLGWYRELRSWSEQAATQLAALEHRSQASTTAGASPAVDRWAEVETELDAILDRLAEAEERCRLHDEATAEIAELRTEELGLRERERALLESIAATRSSAGARPSDTDSAHPPPFRADQRHTVPVADPQWAIVSSAARQRRISFVGSLPLLVVDLEGRCDDAACDRIRRLSELVQMIVLTGDAVAVERLVGDSDGDGAGAAVIEVGRAAS